MKHIFKLPNEYTFEKEGIKGKNFESKDLSDKAKFAVIETEKGHENRIRENETIFNYDSTLVSETGRNAIEALL